MEYTAADGKSYKTKFYNLDAILSVGYRVNSRNATLFRQWANKVLKEYLLRGYAINQRLLQLEERVERRFTNQELHFEEQDRHLNQLDKKVDFFIRTSLPPKEGIFFDGQIFDAYVFVSDLIRRAKKRIVVIDNYIDETVLMQLSKRRAGVKVDLYDGKINDQIRLDVKRHNKQYPGVTLGLLRK